MVFLTNSCNRRKTEAAAAAVAATLLYVRTYVRTCVSGFLRIPPAAIEGGIDRSVDIQIEGGEEEAS